MSAAAVCAALAFGVAPSAAAHVRHAVAQPATTAGGWRQVSDGGVPSIAEPAVHRYGNTLQVAWVQQLSNSERVRTRIYNAKTGTPQGGINTIVSGWASLNEQVALTTYNGERMLVFAGIRSTTGPPGPYDQGTLYYALSPDGVTWTLESGSISHNTDVLAAYGFAAVDDANTTTTAFAISPHSYIDIHRGVSASVPATTADTTTASAPACCVYDPGLGRDAKTHAVWVAWYTNSEKTGWDGINAQPISPAGAHVHAPLSSLTFSGTPSSISPDQSVQVAARVGGGLYTAYISGYPTSTRIVVWKLGASQPAIEIPVHHNDGVVAVEPSIGGRIWVSWVDRTTNRINAARTNKAVTRIGAVRTLAVPNAASASVGNAVGDGTIGPLDLVALRNGSSSVIYFTRVLPGLSASVSKSRVAPRGRFVVTVTDAGAAVAGATVHFGGSSKHTTAQGKVTFTVPAHAKKGRAAVTFSHAGYAGGTVRLKVT
jgi:hypothetical protein